MYPSAVSPSHSGAPIESTTSVTLSDGWVPAPRDTDDSTLASVDIRKHYDDIRQTQRTVRTKSDVSCIKNLHNWIKSVLIRTYAFPLCKVLDLGCGKGGDLLKWGNANISKYVGVDISPTAIDDAMERYKGRSRSTTKPDTVNHLVQNKFDADFFCHDFCCTLPPLSLKFDLCSCQFALHYAFESESRANTFFHNVSESLNHGGVFFATFPNDQVILNRAKHTGKFGNSLYQVDFKNKLTSSLQSPPHFGQKYYFSLRSSVNDCPEYVVHNCLLHDLCEKYNLSVISIKPFQQIVKEQRHKHKQLYNKMNVTTYIPHEEFEVSKLYCAAVLRKNHPPVV